MANEQNLIPQAHKLTVEEQSAGGKKSGEVRRERRDLRKALEALLAGDITTKDGKVMTGAEAITAKLFEQATKGNVKAFEMIRDTVGQKPVEKLVMTDVSEDVINDVERIVSEYGQNRSD